jgi:hypothetical protein
VNFDQILKFSSRILDRSIIQADFVAFRSLLIRPFKFIHSNFKILKGKKISRQQKFFKRKIINFEFDDHLLETVFNVQRKIIFQWWFSKRMVLTRLLFKYDLKKNLEMIFISRNINIQAKWDYEKLLRIPFAGT